MSEELTYPIPFGSPVRICPHCSHQYVTVNRREIDLDESFTQDGGDRLYGPLHKCQRMLAERQRQIDEQRKRINERNDDV